MTPEPTQGPDGGSGPSLRSPRLVRILTMLEASGAAHLRQVCAVCARAVEVDGAGAVLDSGGYRASLCSSDAIAGQLGELCLTLGEGPGVDAQGGGTPVAEPHLARPRQPRWPSFSPLALDLGAAAIFSFPLRVGSIRLGALTLYRAGPGRLSDEQHADALVMADVVVGAVLADQAAAPSGGLAAELESLTRAEVHQASGMVSVQLALTVADALVRLRAHAYVEGRTLSEVARDVVARRLRLGG